MQSIQSEPCCNAPREVEEVRANVIRNLSVRQLNYGYIVEVGCHSFAIETADKLVEKLTAYIRNPADVEKEWFDTKKV